MIVTEQAKLLQTLARALEGMPGPEARACSEAVARVLNGSEQSLDAALGLKPRPGERSWRSEAARAERDRLIRETAAAFFPGMSLRETAEAIAKGLDRFRNSHDWRRARTATTCPFSGIKAKFWNILKLIDRPLGAERIRQILGNEPPAIHSPRDV